MPARWVLVVLFLAAGCEPRDREPAVTPVPAVTPAPAPTPAPRRALWVLAEGSQRPLESPQRIDALLERAARLRVTDLFVQLYRGGRSWFPSTHADDAPARAAASAGDPDPLGRLLRGAHARGMRVHAWFNCLSLALNRDAPLLARLGPQAVLVDRQGRSLLDYPKGEVPKPDRDFVRMGTPGLWLDPAHGPVIEYLEATLDDLIAAAPQLDGLHLDFIRYPEALPLTPGSRFEVGLDFGYGRASVERFERESGRAFARGQEWDDFRRARVDELVRRLDARLPADWEHSAAVIAYADRAYLVQLQDWRHWLEQGWIDFAVAMAYTGDDALLRYLAHGLRGGVGGERVWLGLGAWLLTGRLDRLEGQIALARGTSPAGIALFSYDALAERPTALEALEHGWP
jgi:uncharacterized lipoprotein YddW (UPF0748 family)